MGVGGKNGEEVPDEVTAVIVKAATGTALRELAGINQCPKDVPAVSQCLQEPHQAEAPEKVPVNSVRSTTLGEEEVGNRDHAQEAKGDERP